MAAMNGQSAIDARPAPRDCVASLERASRRLRCSLNQLDLQLGELRRACDEMEAIDALRVSADARACWAADLTRSERRVALLCAAGRSNQEIADTLYVSVHTVKSQLSSAMRKLEVRSRWQVRGVLAGGVVEELA